MKIIGLTGSIGMGKTTTAGFFKELGVPVWNADDAVHRLYQAGALGSAAVGELFPDALTAEGAINREVLAQRVLGNQAALAQLEAVIHPLVGQDRAAFLADARKGNYKFVIVDVPLLFETGGDKHVEAVIVVSCAPELQRQRVMARDGMTAEKFASILARQTPDEQKRARADYVITTDISLDDTCKQVRRLYEHFTTPHFASTGDT
jgi:dephospho-CoA kinase